MITLNRNINSFTDLDFNFIKHPLTTSVSVKKNETAVKQSVLNLLTLRPGDKPFHSEISSPIYPFLFDTITLIDDVIIDGEVKKYLEFYEPRISVSSVSINSTNPNYLNIKVTASFKNTSELFTINVLVNRIR